MRLLSNTVFRLAVALAAGIIAGLLIPEQGMEAVLVVNELTGQLLFFLVPMVIIGFVAPSIASLRGNVSSTLLFAFGVAYASTVGAALFAAFSGYELVPLLHIDPVTTPLRTLPTARFHLTIPPALNVMSALTLSVLMGLGVIWAKSQYFSALLDEFKSIVLELVKKFLIPLLPLYVASNFCVLAYEGIIGRLGVFLPVIAVVIVGHYVWLAVLYLAATAYSRKNGWEVLRHYAPAYLTAIGTMSSAATLGVALTCSRKSDLIAERNADFAIPLFANIHLCGSVLTETFFVCVVSQLLYGQLPAPSTMVVFALLLGIFAVGAPGVPGGTVLASLGIVSSVLGFDDAGAALLIAIFALQDSFGTACNITGDGALTLMVQRFEENKQRRRTKKHIH